MPVDLNKTIFQPLPIKDLNKADYNRPIDIRRVRMIVNEYDEARIGALRVNKRNGKCYIVDGQHRLEALKVLGTKEVMCEISFNLTYQEEAYLYVKLDTGRTNLTRGHAVVGYIESGDKRWIEINNAIESCGLKLSTDGSRGKNKIGSIKEVELIYDKLGVIYLKRICTLLKKTYDGVQESFDCRILSGMRVFISKADERFEDVEFIQKMKHYTPLEIIMEGRRRRTGENIPGGYAEAILYYYNLGRRSKRIPEDLF